MRARSHPKVSRAASLLDAHALAALVEREGHRLSTVTSKKLGPHTATELRELANRIAQLHAEAPSRAHGAAKPVVLEALRTITAIRGGAQLLAPDEPLIAQQLRNIRPARVRAVTQVLLDLESHAALLKLHRARLRPLFPDAFDEQLAQLRGRLLEHGRRRERARSAWSAHRRELDALELRLRELVRTVRAVVAVIQRVDLASALPPR